MNLKLFSKCTCNVDDPDFDCGGYDYIIFKSKWIQFRWFYDNGVRFICVHLGKKYWRWDY